MAVDKLILILLALPLFGALVNGTIGKKLPNLLVGGIATGVMLLSFVCALLVFNQTNDTKIIQLFTLLSLDDFVINASLQVDALSIWMTLIVTGVGTLIHVFSIGYMSHDKGFYKFFTYLNLFIFAMLLLILGSNYFVLFFGWEGVGICSYLLIGFHYSDAEKGIANSIAARKAFIMNRIGDAGLLIGLFLILAQVHTLEFTAIAEKIAVDPSLINGSIIGITICLFIAATGKSAQIPLFTWLPDAMAGPTPVSALIHAATMVTAGIYLVVRSNFLFELAPLTKDIILWIGFATSMIAAFIAMRQNDIKKVLAYSTVSQLGLMFVALGMGAYTVAIFHVTTHAFFKALLFLGSGSVIHAMSDEQDIRLMGGLRKKLPITHLTFLIGTLAIAGFPLLSGFYSKDEILGHALEQSPILYGTLMISVALTAAYMFRLYFLVFHGEFRGGATLGSHVHESKPIMTMPLVVLAILSVFGGLLNLPGIFLSKGTHWLSHFLNSHTAGLEKIKEAHAEPNTTMALMAVASTMTILILIWAYNNYAKKKKIALADNELVGWQLWSNSKLYLDELYDLLFVKPIEWLSKTCYAIVEIKVLNQGVFGLANLFGKTGSLIRNWQTGLLSNYLFWMVFGLIGLISYYIIKLQFWNF
jgi:NADH-quinone oxidoreductase subunit L